jgi:uncharacterized protein
MENKILIGKNSANLSEDLFLLGAMANRHGLVAGATGTGKTITLQKLAEGFSQMGVPVFMADIKGDLSGISMQGTENPKISQRIKDLGLASFEFKSAPVVFWDVYGEQGHPIRATISDMGPVMLSRLLNLNDTQEGVLQLVFKIADERNLKLIDLKDLQALLKYVADHAKEFQTTYGNISATSVGAIQRSLLAIEDQGGKQFFGEPMFDIKDFMKLNNSGEGHINILSADKLMMNSQLYSIFLLWMLSELFENLPEAGDLDKPKLIFFFDEAHLLFTDAPKSLVEKIEQVVRLIRSKGVGVYFVTQNPMDLPDKVLAQLGNRVQHALRAFTPKDKKAVDTVAQTMRANPQFKTEDIITELAVGQALVSVLDEKGTPSVTQSILVAPPQSKIGPITSDQRQKFISSSALYGKYEDSIDADSAFENIQKLNQTAQDSVQAAPVKQPKAPAASSRQSVGEAMVKTAARTMANEVGKQIIRGILGGIFGKR